MRTALEANTWAKIGDDCDMRYNVNRDNDVGFLFGSQFDGFEFVFSAQSLTRFIPLATHALAEAKAMQDDASDTATGADVVCRRD